MKRIALIVEAGATSSSVMTTLDMFRIAARYPEAAGCRLELLSEQGGRIPLNPAVSVDTQVMPAGFDAYAAVILPGFFAERVESITTQLNTVWRPLIERLRLLPPEVLVGASCYGTFVLAESGRLDGRRATTTWWQQTPFRERYPKIDLQGERALVDGGQVITAGAMTAHTDLSLHILRRLFGAALARQVGSIMLVDGARASQKPFMALSRHFADPLVQQAADWLAGHSAEDLSAAQLAAALHVSYRTLHRRFNRAAGMPPLAYRQALRIEQAKELLESSRLGLEQIVEQIGYRDLAAFRRLFLRSAGLSPAQYRQRFKGLPEGGGISLA